MKFKLGHSSPDMTARCICVKIASMQTITPDMLEDFLIDYDSIREWIVKGERELWWNTNGHCTNCSYAPFMGEDWAIVIGIIIKDGRTTITLEERNAPFA